MDVIHKGSFSAEQVSQDIRLSHLENDKFGVCIKESPLWLPSFRCVGSFQTKNDQGLECNTFSDGFALLPPFLGSQRGFVSWARPHWHNRSLLLLTVTLVICPALLTSPSRWLVLWSSGPLWWVVTAGVSASEEVPVKGF